MESGNYFGRLPNELLLEIFSYLSVEDLALSIRHVCSHWREVSRDHRLWKNLIYNPGGESSQEEVCLHLENMPHLKAFVCNRRRNMNLILSSLFRCCKEIQCLKIPDADLRISHLQRILFNFAHIEHLTISVYEKEVVMFAKVLGQCQTLRSLCLVSHFSMPYMGKGILRPIANGCPALQHLDLRFFDVSFKEVTYLLKKKRQQLLSFSYSETSGMKRPEWLVLWLVGECRKLEHICFTDLARGTKLKDLHRLTKLTNLKSIEFIACHGDVLDHLSRILLSKAFSNLLHINISCMIEKSELITKSILSSCPQLRHLDVSYNLTLRDDELRDIGNCCLLEHLHLGFCTKLTDKAMEFVSAGCPKLKHLDVSATYITDRGFQKVVNCKELSVLVFNWNDLSESAVRYVATQLKHLGELSIKGSHLLTKDFIDKMHLEVPQVKIILDISTVKMNDKSYDLIRNIPTVIKLQQ